MIVLCFNGKASHGERLWGLRYDLDLFQLVRSMLCNNMCLEKADTNAVALHKLIKTIPQ